MAITILNKADEILEPEVVFVVEKRYKHGQEEYWWPAMTEARHDVLEDAKARASRMNGVAFDVRVVEETVQRRVVLTT